MNRLAVAAALFGFLWGVCVTAAVVVDVYLYHHDRETLSRWCLAHSRRHPLPHVLFWGVAVVGIIILIVHLYTGWPVDED